MAEIVRRRSWGGVLPLGRHVSISGSSVVQCASASIAPPHPGGAKCYPGAEVQGRTGSSTRGVTLRLVCIGKPHLGGLRHVQLGHDLDPEPSAWVDAVATGNSAPETVEDSLLSALYVQKALGQGFELFGLFLGRDGFSVEPLGQ